MHVVTQYAFAPCKLTIPSHLFARWWCCSGTTISSYLFTTWHLFRHNGYLTHQQQVDFDFLTLKVVSESCDVGYLCANFSPPRPLGPQLRPDVCDRQTDVR